ncbi:MAG TPA: trehalose-phosphatase [Acidimicrobiia bacterium]|nr:trehalose-phosphatase [Acidimicrobiia bacterium]
MPLPPHLAPLSPLVDDPRRAAFLVDFDGSLAPIVDDPAAARPLDAAVGALARLAPLVGRIAVVSGRPAQFLETHVPVPGIAHVGLYGLDRVVDGQRVVDARALEWVPSIAAAADELDAALPGLLVERKGDLAVTVHWRTAPSREADAIAAVSAVALRHGLDAPLRGRMAMELRPPVLVDKGTAVEALVVGMYAAAFAGDDAGDLPAFAALDRLRREGSLAERVTIGVRSPEAPAAVLGAQIVVDGPDGLAVLLAELASAISGRG